jgi:hypothetical protein
MKLVTHIIRAKAQYLSATNVPEILGMPIQTVR